MTHFGKYFEKDHCVDGDPPRRSQGKVRIDPPESSVVKG